MPLLSQLPSTQAAASGVRPNPMITAHSAMSDADRAALRTRVTNTALQRFLEYPYRWTPEALANFARSPENTSFYAIATQAGDAYAFNPDARVCQALIHGAYVPVRGHEDIARELGLYDGTASGQTARDGQVIGFAVKRTPTGIEIDRMRSFFNNQLGLYRELPKELVERLRDELGDASRDWDAERKLEDETFAKMADGLPPEVKTRALELFSLCQTAVWLPQNQLPASLGTELKCARIKLGRAWGEYLAKGYQLSPEDSVAMGELKNQLQLAVKLVFRTYNLGSSIGDAVTKTIDTIDLTGVNPLVSLIDMSELGKSFFQMQATSGSSDSAPSFDRIAELLGFIDDKCTNGDEILSEALNNYLTKKHADFSALAQPMKDALCAVVLAVQEVAKLRFLNIPESLEEQLLAARCAYLKMINTFGVALDPGQQQEIQEIYASTCLMLFEQNSTQSLPFAFSDLYSIYILNKWNVSTANPAGIRIKLIQLNAWVAQQSEPIPEIDKLRKQFCRLALSQSIHLGKPKVEMAPDLTFSTFANSLPLPLKEAASRLLEAATAFVRAKDADKSQKIEALLRAKVSYQKSLTSQQNSGYSFSEQDNDALQIVKTSYDQVFETAFNFTAAYAPHGMNVSNETQMLLSFYPCSELRQIFELPGKQSSLTKAGLEKAMADIRAAAADNWSNVQSNLPALKMRYRLIAAAAFILGDDPAAPFDPAELGPTTI